MKIFQLGKDAREITKVFNRLSEDYEIEKNLAAFDYNSALEIIKEKFDVYIIHGQYIGEFEVREKGSGKILKEKVFYNPSQILCKLLKILDNNPKPIFLYGVKKENFPQLNSFLKSELEDLVKAVNK